MSRIGFLGTGLMGAPMIRRLAAAGHHLRIWNRTPGRAAALKDVAEVCAHPEEAVDGADHVIAMLLDGPATEATLGAPGVIEATADAAILIDMGSVEPDCDRRLSARAVALGRRFIDAPVSGGVVGAEAGTLAIFVGGRPEDAAAAEPLLSVLGRPTHLGPVGAGQAAKLGNQIIVAVTIAAVAEAMKLAESAGCDPALFRDALRGGFAESRILELHGHRMVARDFRPGGRSVAQLKDLRNALALAEDGGLQLPASAAVTQAFADLVEARDGGEYDHAAYYLWLEMLNARD